MMNSMLSIALPKNTGGNAGRNRKGWSLASRIMKYAVFIYQLWTRALATPQSHAIIISLFL